MMCCVGICMFSIHWHRQNLPTFRPSHSNTVVSIRNEDPQDLEEVLRGCKAQATLLLSTVHEQYFSTPVIGLLATSYISDVYMVF